MLTHAINSARVTVGKIMVNGILRDLMNNQNFVYYKFIFLVIYDDISKPTHI